MTDASRANLDVVVAGSHRLDRASACQRMAVGPLKCCEKRMKPPSGQVRGGCRKRRSDQSLRPPDGGALSCRLNRGRGSLSGHRRLLSSRVSGLALFCDSAAPPDEPPGRSVSGCEVPMRRAVFRAHRRRVGTSERSSIRRGACRHGIGGASSQAFERGPGSLRPQAR